jgi:hypothetical protein
MLILFGNLPPTAACNDVDPSSLALQNAALEGATLSSCTGLLNEHLCAYEEQGPISLQSAVRAAGLWFVRWQTEYTVNDSSRSRHTNGG